VTIFTTVVGTLLSVTIMGMLGYNISRKNNKWRKPIAFYVFFTMLFSGGLVPGYILITKYLNLADTVWVLILPGLVNAWHIILFSTFFRSIPDALCESAKIDGASEIKIFYKIIIPLSKPSIATIALFGVLARWNDWYTCLLYIRSEHLLTLQYLLQRIMTDIQSLKDAVNNVGSSISLQDLPSETVKMAMVVLAAGPMLFVFPFFQKYFVKGLTVGSVKG
jgi:putative aldouronate transport system permease protein